MRKVLKKLWKVLEAEGEALGYKFTSVQVNKNFAAEQRHRHPKDTNFQWCASLGQFEGGNLCWLEGNSPPLLCFHQGRVAQDGRPAHALGGAIPWRPLLPGAILLHWRGRAPVLQRQQRQQRRHFVIRRKLTDL